MWSLITALLVPLTLASPIVQRATQFDLKPLLGGSSIQDGSTVDVHDLSKLSTYQLTGGKPSSGETFSTLVVATEASSEVLVAGYGGQKAIGLLGHYVLGLPSTTYAALSITDILHLGSSLKVCIYVYSDPSHITKPSFNRNQFDLDAFVKAAGLGGPVAQLCVNVSGGQQPSSSASSPAASSTSSTASVSTSSASTTSSASASATSSASSSPSAITRTRTDANPAYQTSVSFQGNTYLDKGLVAFGAISPEQLDSTGLTLGGLGSAIAIKSFHKKSDGTYNGEMWLQPDRGHNTQNTVDYQARRHLFGFSLNPYYDAAKLGYEQAKQTFQFEYKYTVLYKALGQATTGIDPLSFTNNTGDIHYPIPTASNRKVSLDTEGLVYNNDGTAWVSDEYGPYVYKFGPNGNLLETIVPPPAVLPMRNDELYFSANSDDLPETGRIQNSGFEGVTISPDGNTLYALLQQGVTQDEADNDEDLSRYSRLFAWDIRGKPALVHAWVLELPITNGKAKTLKQSEFHCISDGTFLVLDRDAKGNGNDDADSKHKDFILYSTNGATDIANTDYTTGVTPVAPGDVIVNGVVPMQGTALVDMIDETQLERFGLHNDGDFDVSLINSKWEGMAFASCDDPANPDDYFLFGFSDNDFITLNGVAPDGPYDDPYAQQVGYSLDNQALVWRVTIPNFGQ